MLDMSVRAKILQLMLDLKDQLDLTYVYITHDLATAKFFCDRVAIMYLGRIVEIGPTEEIFANPKHPYTKALLKAIPEPDPDRMVARDLPRGEIPDAASRRSGARSTRAAPRRSPSAAGSHATSGPCSRSTGPATPRRRTTPSGPSSATSTARQAGAHRPRRRQGRPAHSRPARPDPRGGPERAALERGGRARGGRAAVSRWSFHDGVGPGAAAGRRRRRRLRPLPQGDRERS